MVGRRTILLVIAAIIGIGVTYFGSERLRAEAVRAWQADADQTGQALTSTFLNWLEESYAPVSGMATLFENSNEVSESEFLNAYDGLESRATAFFLDSAAVYKLVKDSSPPRWVLKYTTDSDGAFSAKSGPSLRNAIQSAIEISAERTGEMILGKSFRLENSGTTVSTVALATSEADGDIIVLGLVNFNSMLAGLARLHVPKGFSPHIVGKFPSVDGQGQIHEIVGPDKSTFVHSVRTRTLSAGTELTIKWNVQPSYAGGPNQKLANFTLGTGVAAVILVTMFFGILLRQNATISQRIDDATHELAETVLSLEAGAIARDEIENRLFKREAQLQETMDHMSDGILFIGGDLSIELYNSKVETLLNLPANFLKIGLPIYDLLLFQAKRGDYGAGVPEVIANERLRGQEEHFIEESLDGRILEFNRYFAPGGVIITFDDITQKHNDKIELDSKVEEMELFEKIAVGRELRMIELKEEINTLVEQRDGLQKYEIVE